MPKIFRRFFRSHTLSFHFAWALGIGLGLRFLSAYFVYGPQALDDYKHGVWPAYQFFAGLPLDLPLYRSPLLVWILGGFINVGSWFGVSSALSQVRVMYFGLALLSVSGIYATYIYARLFSSRLFGALALYLVAIYPLMPFVSTRAFGESVAIGFAALGLAWLERARRSLTPATAIWILGFLSLGFATFLRFHVGLMYVSYLAVLVYLRRPRGFYIGLLVGFVLVGGEALIDVLAGRGPLSTLFVYLVENEGGGAKYGVSPWYNPILFVLALSLAPFSFVFYRGLKGLWREHLAVIVPAMVFLLAHVFVAHKEERFLYPLLILELWCLAYLWAASSHHKWSRRLYTPVFSIVLVLVLPIVCLVNTQEGEIEPPALIEKRFGHVIYFDYKSLFGESRFKFYFLREPSEMQPVELSDFNINKVESTLSDAPAVEAVAFITSDLEGFQQMKLLEKVSSIGAECLSIEHSGSVMDRLLFAMNPKHNKRRRPTWYLVCERR